MQKTFNVVLALALVGFTALPAIASGPEIPAALYPVAQVVITALITSGALGAFLSMLFRSWLKANEAYRPVVQKGENYLEWAEVQAIHIAEMAGVHTDIGPAAKLKLAVDYVLDIAKDAGIPADASAVTVEAVTADIERLLPLVYKGHGQTPKS